MKYKCICVSCIISFCALFSRAIAAEAHWATAPTIIPIWEYLDFYFKLHMGRPDLNALNGFNIVTFWAGRTPDESFVIIMQSWSDSPLPQIDLRREIRKVGDAYFAQFKAMTAQPWILMRWPISDSDAPHFIIKHVRKSDTREVLGVTVNGTTSFDDDAIKKARQSVTSRGSSW